MLDLAKSIGPSIVAALTAILVATSFSRRQKREDRQTEHRRYLRETYADFVCVILHLSEHVQAATVEEHEVDIWRTHPLAAEARLLYQKIHLYAPDIERQAARDLSAVLGGLIYRHRDAMISGSVSPAELAEDVGALLRAVEVFVDTVREAQKHHLGIS